MVSTHSLKKSSTTAKACDLIENRALKLFLWVIKVSLIQMSGACWREVLFWFARADFVFSLEKAEKVVKEESLETANPRKLHNQDQQELVYR